MDTKALRQKILDLAIRGKLVPQDPNDEPAVVLLERIRAEKQQMVKDGKLKPKDIKNDTVIFKCDDNLHYEKFSDGSVKCIEDEIPFDVPDNWEWVRLGAICPYGDNKAISSDSINESSWILDLEDIEKDTGLIKHYTTKTERNSLSNKYAFTTGQLLYSKLRPYLNKVVIATKNGYCTTEILPLIFYGNISAKYMQIFMMSPTFLAYANMISYGVKMPRLGTSDGKNALIAIPPINEQLRIRKQFDIIIPLLRKIEKHNDTLHSNILATKSKILDLAIRGKLVPQDPNDEPASVLLEHIRAEKEELIRQGKIKRDKKESVIFKGDDNSYYEKYGEKLPSGWVVTNFETLLSYEQPTNYIVKNTNYNSEYETPVLTAGKSFILGYTDEKENIFSELPVIIFDDFTTESKFVDFPFKVKSSAMKILHINTDLVLPKFAFYLMQATEIDHDNHQRYWISTYSQEEIALPPLKEQERILSALEQYFKLLNCLL